MTNLDKENASASVRTFTRSFCPFVKEPFDECLCTGTGSDSVEAAIRLCGGNFESCEIFRNRWSERRVES